MPKSQGRLAQVHVSTDGGTTFAEVGGLESATLHTTRGEINVSSHDSGASSEYLQGRKDHTCDISCFYDNTNTPQQAMVDNAHEDEAPDLIFRFYPRIGGGYKMATGAGIVNKADLSAGNDDALKIDFTVRITGALVWSAQP
jgi:predicted secreted protein